MAIAKAKLRADRLKKKEVQKAKDAAFVAYKAAQEEEIEVDDELVQPQEGLEVDLVQPETVEQPREKIKVVEKVAARKSKLKRKSGGLQSALIPGEGRSMGMELD
jgi:hypothetical protein